MAITATYTVTLSASDKDHARGEYVYASIVRTSLCRKASMSRVPPLT